MTSLEELLADDGFKKSRLRHGLLRRQAAPQPKAVTMPLYPISEQSRRDADTKAWRGRAQSDFFSRRSHSTASDPAPRPPLARRKSSLNNGFDSRSEGSRYYYNAGYDDDDDDDEDDRESDYDDESMDRFSTDRFSDEIREEETRFRPIDVKKSFKLKPSFRDENRISNVRTEDAGNSSGPPEPGLDEAAIQAVASILTGYIRRFFKDENFRASIRHSCLSWLESSKEKEERTDKTPGVVANLKEAIGTIERAANGFPDPKDMKRASLKLSVITGLSSGDLRDGSTSGIPNLHLSACAHLYLSLFYRLQKKDKVSGKHILQVFCESPRQARTALLPALWDHLFFPHLNHLRNWYQKETQKMPKSSTRLKKLQVLENVYSNAVDEGTCLLAVYYKKWLTEDNGDPVPPAIGIPDDGFSEADEEEEEEEEASILSPASLQQPIVSKRLYDHVFSQSKRKEIVEEANDNLTKEKEEEEEFLAEKQSKVLERSNASTEQEDEGTEKSNAPKSGRHVAEAIEQYHGLYANHSAKEWADEEAHRSSIQGIPQRNEVSVHGENLGSWPHSGAPNLTAQAKEHELALKKLAEAVFRQQEQFPEYELPPHHPPRNRNETTRRRNGMSSTNSQMNSSVARSSAEPFGCSEDIDQGSFFSSMPEEFMCPLTGHLFEDPVTLETGQTFERAAIIEWFEQGNKTCPITGRGLESVSVPHTNFVLMRVIDGWRSENCRNLLIFATQIAVNSAVKDHHQSKDESALLVMEQLLTGFDPEEQIENAKHLISIGGLHFLTRRLELGNLEEKVRVVSLLLCCIKADGSCRSFLSVNIKGLWILELLHSKKVNARAIVVQLMIELICLSRRLAIKSFLSGLHTETIVNTMHILLVYLQSSVPEERALLAALLLHLDLMAEHRRYSIYREEAVDGIIVALECSLDDGKLTENCRRGILMLGGYFSSTGEIMTETWLLKQAGFYANSSIASGSYEDQTDEIVSKEEEKEREEWLNTVALVLLRNGKRSLLETLCRCLASEKSELVRICLITVAWLSHTIPSLSASRLELSEFTALIPLLKESMDSDEQIEHRVLASISLLNFSKIPECKALLKTFAKEMLIPLKSLVEVTWTAKQLYVAIFGEN